MFWVEIPAKLLKLEDTTLFKLAFPELLNVVVLTVDPEKLMVEIPVLLLKLVEIMFPLT